MPAQVMIIKWTVDIGERKAMSAAGQSLRRLQTTNMRHMGMEVACSLSRPFLTILQTEGGARRTDIHLLRSTTILWPGDGHGPKVSCTCLPKRTNTRKMKK